MATPRVWLVTGASSGIGKSLTEFVLSKGDIVVATLRKPKVLQELSASYSKDKLLVLKVDVTNQADIEHAFARTREVFGRLDVVFSNAGYSIFGDAETTPIDIARAMFDVNFWGAVNVGRMAIKFFREVNEPGRGGVLLQNSSLVGIDSTTGMGFYGASKHGETCSIWDELGTYFWEHAAIEGFLEGLAKEILPRWNIKICIIQPGAFNTNAVLNAIVLPENPVYNDKTSALTTVRSMASAPEFRLKGDPAKLVKAIYSLVEDGDMPLHLPIGQDALAVAKEKIVSLGKEISKAAPWSTDLLRDDITQDKLDSANTLLAP